MIKKESLSKLLAGEVNHEEEKGETFEFNYRGHSEIDRHYTKPMLPWIISEIKNQNKCIKVKVTVKDGLFEVVDSGIQKTLLTHSLKQIHKCVMEQADHRCFLYTLRPPEKQTSPQDTSEDLSTPVPCNIGINKNYQCHLYQALNELEVKNFFSCLRQQPREVKMPQDIDSLNSLADLSVHTESQFFEVLFVGRVKVSRSKVPETFIDEALNAFRLKEKTRKRNVSGENKATGSPNRVSSYQSEGSGYSVPNITLQNTLEKDSAVDTYNKDTGESMIKHKPSRVRFQLGGSLDLPCDSPRNSPRVSPQSSLSAKGTECLREKLKVLQELESIDDNESKKSEDSDSEDSKITIEPLLQRMRQCSIGDGSNIPDLSVISMFSESKTSSARARANSMGSFMQRNKALKTSNECDMKTLGYDFNRTMLFHIGHREIQLINPELKSVQLHKPFKDVACCSQGVKANDHFGFICRELSGDTMVFVGYIFRCNRSAVADEIMQALNRSFSAMHEAHQRDRKEHLMCDYCPLKWFSQLCAEVEGLAASRAHATIMKRVATLPEDENELIITKYEGAETSELVQKNNVLMLLLRTHFEYKQSLHSHPAIANEPRSEFHLGTNIESSLKKARKSITSFLKRDQRDSESAEKDTRLTPENTSTISTPERLSSPSRSVSKASSVLEGISDSPLRSYRQRSSTVSSGGGDSIRKEIMSRKSAEKENLPPESAPQLPGPKMNIFLKFGTPASPPVTLSEEKEESRPTTSFRHAILQTVVSPSKMLPENLHRKTSTVVAPPNIRRSTKELMILWKKSIFQQILLLRIERENQRRRAIQKEFAILKAKLNYDSEDIPDEAIQTWELLLSRPQARIDSNVLRSGIRQGVPKLLRGEIWNLMTIQDRLFSPIIRQNLKDNLYPEHYNTSYEDILKELTSQHHAILIDLGRTFPSHPYFTQTLGPGQLSLFNILKAYSILDQEVGYCQGLSFVGGILLMHVDEDLAYELLKHLMFDKGCRKQYRPDLDGLQIRMYQLSRLVHDRLKDLYNHLEKYEIIPQLYAAPWFLTLFASQFPLPFVGRVFDLLFMDGMESVFRVCLVLLQTHSENLLSLENFELIMEYFRNVVPDISTCDIASFFVDVCECDVEKELSAYQVEYQVLQEELSLSPQQDANNQKFREANKNLKRQNLDLLEQIHTANHRQLSLESSNQSLKQNQHHLEVRVRWLEFERNNMRNLISMLCQNAPKNVLDRIPPNLERYLPNKSSTPMARLKGARRHSTSQDDENFGLEGSAGVPHQHSFSPIRIIKELDSETPSVSQGHKFPSTVKSSISEEPTRPRSSTLDPQTMQKYFKKVVRAD